MGSYVLNQACGIDWGTRDLYQRGELNAAWFCIGCHVGVSSWDGWICWREIMGYTRHLPS
jgi:hypothetical protein